VFGKVRCGGLRIPPVEELAHYVSECARLGVPFKATAGMHAAVLASTDAGSLAAEALSLDPDLVTETRALFHSYGSCDTARPITDAEKLGLL
jgi:hypothetical protein